MMIAARNSFLIDGGAKTPTARDYVQDGLVAMWDGMENAGWGQHDASATTWKDLIGDNDITLTMGGGNWISSGGLFIAKSPKTTGVFKRSETTYKQIEVAGVELTGNLSYDRHILISFGATHSFLIGQNRIGFVVASNVVGIEPTYPASNNRANVPFSVSVSYTPENLPDPNAMYYNGEKKQQAGQTISVGGLTGAFNNYGSYQADANIYCIRLYSRALTAAEVAANYAIDAARFGL